MEILRTPDDRFANLPDFPFAPHYAEVPSGEGEMLRLHYLDEGPPDAPPVLLMHGEPSWSFLYRKMIPIIVAAGYRAVAPDLIGFGRSDKPARTEDHTYARHVAWMWAWLAELGLDAITLVCQDWGGLIGLRLVAEGPERFARVVTANTGLPTGDVDLGEAFREWRTLSQTIDPFPVGRIVQGGTVSTLPNDVVAAYDAPFPDESYKAAARIMPSLVPSTPDDPASADNRAAWEVLRQWQKPFLTAYSDSDPLTARTDLFFRRAIPGAKGQPHTTIEKGGHFLQEDQGEQLAQVVIDFIRATT